MKTAYFVRSASYIGCLFAAVCVAEDAAQQAKAVPSLAQGVSAVVKEMAAKGIQGQTNIGVGEFFDGSTDKASQFSALLKAEFEKALSAESHVKVITRERLGELELEGRFQSDKSFVQGNTTKIQVKGIDILVRGRLFRTGEKVAVHAELVHLSGGEIVRASVELPATLFAGGNAGGIGGAGMPTVAVLYFQNHSQKNEELEGFAKGMLPMVVESLQKTKKYYLVERDRLDAALAELKLAKDGVVDAAAAAKMGKILGASHLVMGSVFQAFGKYRIDARMVEVETGSVVQTASATGNSDQMFDLAEKVSAGLSVK